MRRPRGLGTDIPRVAQHGPPARILPRPAPRGPNREAGLAPSSPGSWDPGPSPPQKCSLFLSDLGIESRLRSYPWGSGPLLLIRGGWPFAPSDSGVLFSVSLTLRSSPPPRFWGFGPCFVFETCTSSLFVSLAPLPEFPACHMLVSVPQPPPHAENRFCGLDSGVSHNETARAVQISDLRRWQISSVVS